MSHMAPLGPFQRNRGLKAANGPKEAVSSKSVFKGNFLRYLVGGVHKIFIYSKVASRKKV